MTHFKNKTKKKKVYGTYISYNLARSKICTYNYSQHHPDIYYESAGALSYTRS